MADTDRYILLPRRGVRASSGLEGAILNQIPTTSSVGKPNQVTLEALGVDATVIDTVGEDRPKLVELTPEAAARVNAPDSPVRAVREVFYPLPQPAEGTIDPASTAAAGSTSFTFKVKVTDASSGAGIPDAQVRAFTSVANRVGAEGRTDAAGVVQLSVPGATLERLLAMPDPGKGYWSGYKLNVAANGVIQVPVAPLVTPYTDCVQHYFNVSNFISSTGVLVGIVDTGCGPHADLNIVDGRNTVTGEPRNDWQDSQIHGTHVAGLVGARGTAPNGMRGVAPGAKLFAYRVFGAGARYASNYAIIKAMILAEDVECDILNLSLGGGPHSEIVEEAIESARNHGMLVVIAAGNNYRAAVNYPAAYPGATAISAMGRSGTFPAGSTEELQVVRPPHATVDPAEFIAGFSNVGPQIAVAGPGVGAISTLPHNRIGPLSGTSMAAPAVAGAAACLLSQNGAIYGMTRNRARSDAIKQLLQTNCGRRGFGSTYEGYGVPQSPMV